MATIIRTISLLALALSLVLALPVLAQQQPRACLSKDDDSSGGLPSNDPEVIYDKPQIVHQQTPYSVEVFSATAPKPQQRFDQCFRYEAEDAGPNNINAFYWGLAGLWLDPMYLKSRYSRKKVLPVDDTPREIRTRLTAFANDQADTKAWGPVPRPKEQAQTSARFDVNVLPDDVLAGLAEYLRNHKLPPRPLTAFYLHESGQEASTLEDAYNGPDIKIELRSDAKREGDHIVLRTEVVAGGSASTEARYLMPALLALQVPQQELNFKAYDEFLSRYQSAQREAVSYQPSRVFTLSVPASTLPGRAVYRMLHPIAIERKGERACFLAASYAPLALSFSLQDCPVLFRDTPR
jgi:hypothetical protein